MGFEKEDSDKDYYCRQCAKALDSCELIGDNCPTCLNSEDVFINESNVEREEESVCAACNNTGHHPEGMYGVCEYCDNAWKETL